MARIKAPFRMMPRQILSSPCEMGIEVLSGRVWLTHAGCLKDWVLEPGDKAMLSPGRASVLYALAESEIWMESKEARASLWGARGA